MYSFYYSISQCIDNNISSKTSKDVDSIITPTILNTLSVLINHPTFDLRGYEWDDSKRKIAILNIYDKIICLNEKYKEMTKKQISDLLSNSDEDVSEEAKEIYNKYFH